MKKNNRLRTSLLLFFLLASFISANNCTAQSIDLSLQGFSGILNTPTGHVQSEGSFAALYSNQSDRLRGRTPRWQDNYLISVGLFNFAEIGGRLIEARGIARDLSANLKVSTAPFTAQLPFSPAIALGIQDLSGGATFLRTSYLAASADPSPWIRLSAGYGRGSDRMDGIFGGIELKAHDWVRILGEYDTLDFNAGLRLSTPPLGRLATSLTFTAKTALNHSTGVDISFGLTLPLDQQKRASKKQRNTRQPAPSSSLNSATRRESQLATIQTRLIEAGFANLRVGTLDNRTLIIEYENVRYNHNELDALGVVAGIATATDLEGFDRLRLVVKRKGLRILRVSAPYKKMRNWLAGSQTTSAPSLEISTDTTREGANFITGNSNPDWLKPTLILAPGLKTFIGTEAGVFDYQLSLKPELQVTIWKGGILNARWDLPLAWSDNFEDGRPFAHARNESQFERLMLFQGIKLAPGLIASLSAGKILPQVNGTINELSWSPGSGMHRFAFTQAYARNTATKNNKDVWLGSYRLYLPSLDLFVKGTAGRFWNQDSGGRLSLKRFFGDTAVDLYYKNTKTLENKHWQAAGIEFSFPLTPRRDMKRAPLQIRGTEEWSYFQETLLTLGNQRTNDTISAGLGVNPLPSPGINRSYLNRDRLNREYVLKHRGRLKEAWQLFRNGLSKVED